MLKQAWVPIVGPAGALTVLSALPSEQAARNDVHGPLYLRPEEMQDFAYQGVLSRAQMELLAARTSYLNDCRY